MLFLFFRNHVNESPVLSRSRGVRVVTDVGRDAMDANALAGRAARLADGEVVWSWRPLAGAKSVDDDRLMTVTMMSRTPGRARSSVNTIAQGMPVIAA